MNDATQKMLDTARHPGKFFISWGIPIIALATANFLTTVPTLAALLVTGAFAWIGVACLSNAWGCNRVHCWFTGPWALLVSVALFLYAFVGIRPAWTSFSDIANYGGLITLILWFVPELIFGKYFKGRAHE